MLPAPRGRKKGEETRGDEGRCGSGEVVRTMMTTPYTLASNIIIIFIIYYYAMAKILKRSNSFSKVSRLVTTKLLSAHA